MTKEEILEKMITNYEEADINGMYLIPLNERFDEGDYSCIQLIGYNYDENKQRRYYDLGDFHDVVNFMNFGMSGISIDSEMDNGLIRVFWNDRKPRKVKWMDAHLSIIIIYGEEIV